MPSEKDELIIYCENISTIDIKTYGLYFLLSMLFAMEITTLKKILGDEIVGALLSFSMMHWGYQCPIKRADNYHSHEFSPEKLFSNTFNDKCIIGILRTVGENREKVIGWMKSLLDDLPEEGKNFVMMDSAHVQSLSGHLNV